MVKKKAKKRAMKVEKKGPLKGPQQITSPDLDGLPDVKLYTNALITGSHAYGRPTEVSDVDLVILTSRETIKKLKTLADEVKMAEVETKIDEYGECSACLYFGEDDGQLNLICVTSADAFLRWQQGTNTLKARKAEQGHPVSREEAKDHFRLLELEAKQEEDGVEDEEELEEEDLGEEEDECCGLEDLERAYAIFSSASRASPTVRKRAHTEVMEWAEANGLKMMDTKLLWSTKIREICVWLAEKIYGECIIG